MSYLLSIFTGLKYLGRHFDDDPTDQLHYRITSNTLICLAIVVSFKQFGGKPIECMMPDHLPGPWEQFAENFCWAQDTYYLSFDQDLTRAEELRNARIGYYQWVPFFLLLSALSFQIPAQIWRFLSSSSGIRLESLVEQAIDPKNIVLESRQQAIRTVAVHLENALKFHHRLHKRQMVPHKVLRFLNLPYKAFFMTFIYLIIKIMYALNVFAQFFIMNFFLQTDNQGWYGWTTLNNLLNGTQWSTSGFFPRVTLCDFHIRVPGTVQRYSIQCVLSINLFTEKIFIFLWFWYHILGIVTVLSLLYWLIVCCLPWFPRWFVVRHLELADMPFDPVQSEQSVRRFVHHYLRTDGVFVLRMINMHTGVIFSSEVVAVLYKSHLGIDTLVKSASQSKKWPDIDQIKQLLHEKVHPPPPTGLDQPDRPGMVTFSLGPKKKSDETTQSLMDEGLEKKALSIEDEENGDDEIPASPFSSSATRKRHTTSSEKV